MAMLLVGYDLNSPGQDYDALYERLKGELNWWHHLDSTWLVKTMKSPKDFRDELVGVVGSNDELFVVDITGDAAAWSGFSAMGSDWLKRQL